MTTVIIPTASDRANYTERITLEGVQYVLKFRWNTRMIAWFVSISDENGNPLAIARRCVADWPITTQQRPIAGMPQGMLIAFDTTRRQDDPRLQDFGTRVLLAYVEAAG